TPSVVKRFLDHLDVLPATRTGYHSILRHFFAALAARGVTTSGLIADAADAESLEDQFARFSPIERQATMDAAATSLPFHDIPVFTEGQGGSAANVDLSL